MLLNLRVDSTAFLIGSTCTPSFERNQKLHKTPFAETRTPEGLPEGTPVPTIILLKPGRISSRMGERLPARREGS